MNIKKIKNVIVRSLSVYLIIVMGISLFACSKNNSANYLTFDENLPVNELIKQKQETYKTMNENITITPEEAAKGKTVENTKRTVNEYGITIYGKPISEQEVLSKGLNSEIGIENDKERGRNVTYTEYYSDAYGGKVYVATVVDTGSIEIFNEKGKRFLAGRNDSKTDIEVGLANYRMGNALAEAIDKTYKK